MLDFPYVYLFIYYYLLIHFIYITYYSDLLCLTKQSVQSQELDYSDFAKLMRQRELCKILTLS